jgi:hypothetical protein
MAWEASNLFRIKEYSYSYSYEPQLIVDPTTSSLFATARKDEDPASRSIFPFRHSTSVDVLVRHILLCDLQPWTMDLTIEWYKGGERLQWKVAYATVCSWLLFVSACPLSIL